MKHLDADMLKAAFNDAGGDVRVVTIVSPTCPECIQGYRVVDDLFSHFETDRLKGFIVWIPMLDADTPDVASRQAATLEDPRILLHGWDAHRYIGTLFEATLDLTRTAWDAYLLYAPPIVWSGELPPPPTSWMHQLDPDSGADQRDRLHPHALIRQVDTMLRASNRSPTVG